MQLIKLIFFFSFLLSILLLFLLFYLMLLCLVLALLFSFLPFLLWLLLLFSTFSLLLLAYAVLLVIAAILFFVAFIILIFLHLSICFTFLRQYENQNLSLILFFILEWKNLNVKRGKSVAVKETSIFLFAMRDRYHLSVVFEYSVALLDASQHVGYEIFLTKKAINSIFLNDNIKTGILKRQFLLYVVKFICDFGVGIGFATIFNNFFGEIKGGDIMLESCKLFIQVRTATAKFQDICI